MRRVDIIWDASYNFGKTKLLRQLQEFLIRRVNGLWQELLKIASRREA